MGAGGVGSIWAAPEYKTDPKEIFNFRLFFLAVTLAFAGSSWGFDQGNIGGVLTLPSFRRAFGLDKLSPDEADEKGQCFFGLTRLSTGLRRLTKKSRGEYCVDECVRPDEPATTAYTNIVRAIVAIGASVGSLLSAPLADFAGRKISMMIVCPVFIIGAGMQESAVYNVFLAGRFIAGLAIGAMSMLAPQYLAENSPKSIRGSLTYSCK